MSFSSILRGAGRGVASVGRAVQSASRSLDQAVAGTPAPAPEQVGPPAPEQSGVAPASGFMLPDIGPAPDQNAPEFQGEGGAEKYAQAAADYQHKQDIHQAFQDLDKIYSEAHPQRDFMKEYKDFVAEQQKHEAERPRGNSLARAALALGDFNPAVQQSGRSNLEEYNRQVEAAARRSDVGFAQRMELKMKAHEAAAADAEAQGNWKKALAEREKMALLSADAATLAHKREMEKVGAQQKGAAERAGIRADAMKRVAETRARTIAGSHGLTGSFMTTFEKEAAKAVARFLGPRDIMKEYTTLDLENITDYLEHLAEIIHDQQYGTGSADTYVRTPPSKRPQPKAEKEKF